MRASRIGWHLVYANVSVRRRPIEVRVRHVRAKSKSSRTRANTIRKTTNGTLERGLMMHHGRQGSHLYVYAHQRMLHTHTQVNGIFKQNNLRYSIYKTTLPSLLAVRPPRAHALGARVHDDTWNMCDSATNDRSGARRSCRARALRSRMFNATACTCRRTVGDTGPGSGLGTRRLGPGMGTHNISTCVWRVFCSEINRLVKVYGILKSCGAFARHSGGGGGSKCALMRPLRRQLDTLVWCW